MADLLIPDVNNAHPVSNFATLRAFSPVLIAKMTEGESYTAPSFPAHRIGAQGHRFAAFGAYHFWRDGDPVAQAHHAARTLAPLRRAPAEFLVLDVEQGVDWPAYAAFCRTADTALGRTTWLYGGRGLADAPASLRRNRPLWVARYYHDYSPDPAHAPGIGETLWQFSDRHPIPGVGHGDCSVYRGSATRFVAAVLGQAQADQEDDMTPAQEAKIDRLLALAEKHAADEATRYDALVHRSGHGELPDVLAAVKAIDGGGADAAAVVDEISRRLAP